MKRKSVPQLRPRTETTRISRRWAIAACALLAGAFGAAEAAADIEVHVRNCTRSALHVTAYDAKDTAETFPASEHKFAENNRGETHHFPCHGEGRGYCKVRIITHHGPDSDSCIEQSGGEEGYAEIHLESGHRADVIAFEVTDDGCKPWVETAFLAEDCNYEVD